MQFHYIVCKQTHHACHLSFPRSMWWWRWRWRQGHAAWTGPKQRVMGVRYLVPCLGTSKHGLIPHHRVRANKDFRRDQESTLHLVISNLRKHLNVHRIYWMSTQSSIWQHWRALIALVQSHAVEIQLISATYTVEYCLAWPIWFLPLWQLLWQLVRHLQKLQQPGAGKESSPNHLRRISYTLPTYNARLAVYPLWKQTYICIYIYTYSLFLSICIYI